MAEQSVGTAYPVGSEEDGPEEAAIDGGLVHHNTILLVVAAIASNGHNGVVACWELPAQTPLLPELSSMQGFHWISALVVPIMTSRLMLVINAHWHVNHYWPTEDKQTEVQFGDHGHPHHTMFV